MAKIGDAERTVQNHVISMFRNHDFFDYVYYVSRRTAGQLCPC
jgi:hypothetical protein